MGKFKLSDYNDVASRINQFRKEYPHGVINSELLIDEADRLVFVARVWFNKEDSLKTAPNGTGYAEEERGSTHVNETSALENCETSAWGRALAACGYGAKKIASVEEIQIAENKRKKQEQKAKEQQEEREYKKAIYDASVKYADLKGIPFPEEELAQRDLIVYVLAEAGFTTKLYELEGEKLKEAAAAVVLFVNHLRDDEPVASEEELEQAGLIKQQ